MHFHHLARNLRANLHHVQAAHIPKTRHDHGHVFGLDFFDRHLQAQFLQSVLLGGNAQRLKPELHADAQQYEHCADHHTQGYLRSASLLGVRHEPGFRQVLV